MVQKTELKPGDTVTFDGRDYKVELFKGALAFKPIAEKPKMVRLAVGVEKRDGEYRVLAKDESHRTFPASDCYWERAAGWETVIPRTEITIDPTTGKIHADEPEWVADVVQSLRNVRSFLDVAKSDLCHRGETQVHRDHIDNALAKIPRSHGGYCPVCANKFCACPRWLYEARLRGAKWVNDPDLRNVKLPDTDRLKDLRVEVIGFRHPLKTGDAWLTGSQCSVMYGVCDPASFIANGKRLIVRNK